MVYDFNITEVEISRIQMPEKTGTKGYGGYAQINAIIKFF